MPANFCTGRSGPSYAGLPSATQVHVADTGHAPHAGEVAVHTSAPSSITATDHSAASASRSGSTEVARARSAALMAGRGCSVPVSSRASTRRTFVSSTTARCPKANDCTAAAV